MGFFGYLILGSVVYVVGFMINLKMLTPKRQAGVVYTLTHPTIMGLLACCFVLMILVSALMGRFLLHHNGFDVAFIMVNSVVASVVFYFGLNPDQKQMNLPD